MINVGVYACMYACLYVCMYVCMFVCLFFVFLYVYTYFFVVRERALQGPSCHDQVQARAMRTKNLYRMVLRAQDSWQTLLESWRSLPVRSNL